MTALDSTDLERVVGGMIPPIRIPMPGQNQPLTNLPGPIGTGWPRPELPNIDWNQLLRQTREASQGEVK
jgi:hypothetical protein